MKSRFNNRPALIASIMLITFIVLSVWLIKQYIHQEQQRDIQGWQDKLSVIAESKKRAIESWLDNQFQNLDDLASNPLLQIYLGVSDDEEFESDTLNGQVAHLRNLITATVQRAGVFEDVRAINANTVPENDDGLAVVDAGAKLKLSTHGFPRGDVEIIAAIKRAFTSGKNTVADIYANAKGDARIILVVPVKPVQFSRGADYAGAIVAVIKPEAGLYRLVTEHWLTTTSDETLLVQGDEFSTSYVSPLQDGVHLFHKVPRSNLNNAANFARENIADFAIKTDYRSQQVLVTSRYIANTDWLLVQKITADEALRESSAHREFVFTLFLFAIFIITMTFIAVWRHATSLRLQKTSDRLLARTDLLNAVTDNINDHILMLDHDDRLVFINRSLAKIVSSDTADIRGKSLNHIFDRETTEMLLKSADDGDVKNHISRLTVGDEDGIYHVNVAILSSGKYKTSRLFVLHDISELHEAEQTNRRLLEGIIATLVQITDLHDPHCAHHSERTQDVSIAIAEAMSLSEQSVETLSMASMLANIGKLNLPRELLTKMEPLTQDEEAMMRNNINDTISILQTLAFDGPVVDVIRQKNEHLDGSGYPEGLRGDEILTESRILAVANAFVAMSSARAYRPGKPVREVLDILLQDAEQLYDRTVVSALFHVAETRKDWAEWQTVKQR